uniref:Uncharacterized protein LOC100180909 n=1 Tax=Phallusia mammillata TaxID=59560 RepID=A0A6F9DHE1_9ASCI|nr:uncharacterized protein LOC100180909 [Phallusia mammillata]
MKIKPGICFLLSLIANAEPFCDTSEVILNRAVGSSVTVNCTLPPTTAKAVTWFLKKTHHNSFDIVADLDLYDLIPLCTNQINSVIFSCNQNDQNVETSLVVSSLNIDDEILTLRNGSSITDPILKTVHLKVSYCQQLLQGDLSVKLTSAQSPVFNAEGQFSCKRNILKLFYTNGKRLTRNNTKCLKDATWSNSKDLDCWAAVLGGTQRPFYEGNKANFTCDLDSQINSVTNFSKTFYFANGSMINVNTPLTALYDNVKIYCLLNFTNGDTLKSGPAQLDVRYVPFWDNKNGSNCSYPCSFQFRSNPQASWALYKGLNITPKGSVTPISPGNWKFATTESTLNATYILKLSNGVGNVSFSFDIVEPIPTTPTPNPQNLPIAAIAGAAGAVVVILIIVLAVLFYKRRNKAKDEKEVRENPLYGSSQNAGGNGAVDTEANKKKKKTKEMKVNVAYQPASPDVIEDAYGGVNTGEREMKDNILYGSSGPSAQPMEDAYAEVNKGKKNKKGKKEMKVNVA